MSDLMMVSRLELNRNDPRDARIAERIARELGPVAESIMAEYRQGYTAEEILAEARRRREQAARRAKASEIDLQKSQEADAAFRERQAPPEELMARLVELTSEGPIKLSWIKDLLYAEGWNGEDLDKAIRARDRRIRWTQEDSGGAVWVERREREEAVPA